MPRNTTTTTIDRLVDAGIQNGDVLMDAARYSNERTYRFGRIVIDEAERTQHERAELFRQWAHAPTDLTGFTNALFETWTRRTRRRVELARTLLDDLRDIGAGTRSIWERVADANRNAMQATANAGRRTASAVAEEVAERADDVSDAVDDASRNLRRRSRHVEPKNN